MKNHYKIVREKILRWIIFSVLFALLPFLGNYFVEISKGHEVTLGSLFGNGELLLVGVTLCGVGLGELFGIASSKTATPPVQTYIVAGGSLMVVVLASLYYANISSGTEFRTDTVAWISAWLFSFSVIMSTGCIYIAAIAEIEMIEKLVNQQIAHHDEDKNNESSEF
jgi:hypothetical protein